MSDQSRTTAISHGYGGHSHESAQYSHQTAKFLTAATVSVSLLLLFGLTLTSTVIGLVLFTPVLVLFSPILVPAGIVLLLAAIGLMFSGGCGMAAVTALTWIYNYVAGKHPPGADKLDYARMVIADKARDVTERAKEYRHYGQQGRAHEATQGY